MEFCVWLVLSPTYCKEIQYLYYNMFAKLLEKSVNRFLYTCSIIAKVRWIIDTQEIKYFFFYLQIRRNHNSYHSTK